MMLDWMSSSSDDRDNGSSGPEEKEGKGKEERRLIKLRDTGDDNEMVAVREEEKEVEEHRGQWQHEQPFTEVTAITSLRSTNEGILLLSHSSFLQLLYWQRNYIFSGFGPGEDDNFIQIGS
jgi:hypothetical protein